MSLVSANYPGAQTAVERTRPAMPVAPVESVTLAPAPAPSPGGTPVSSSCGGAESCGADQSRPYSARTSFDTSTGEWALVIERHPPEVGITIAVQRGFLSQYSARVSSASGLMSAYTANI